MDSEAALVMTFAALVVLVLVVRVVLQRLGVPAIVGFLALGVTLRLLAEPLRFGEGAAALHLLGKVGVTILLFRVGLESDLRRLVRQLRCASLIWIGNMALSFAVAYVAARYLLGMGLVPSLVIATALIATSVGIPSAIWRETGRLRTTNGERFIDAAELDDLSGVMALALLFAVLPELRSPGESHAPEVLARQGGLFLGKLLLFGAGCFLYSRYVEAHVTGLLQRLTALPDVLIGVVATGLIVAGLAGVLGFSMAIGAFFAGLAYSRDPQQTRLDRSMPVLYDLFVPLFFVSVGFSLYPESLGGALLPAGVLLLAAVVGKLFGTAAPAWPFAGAYGALVLGVSMVPRAEICLLVAQRAQGMGPDILPPQAFTAIVLVAAVTVALGPIILRRLLVRLPQGRDEGQ